MHIEPEHDNPLDHLQCLLWDGHAKVWCARARDHQHFAKDADPEQAILKAIALRDEPKEIEHGSEDVQHLL
jgi:hypothetical protein